MSAPDREALLLDFAEQAMVALIPTFGDQVEAKRKVIAHKSFLLASAMLDAYNAHLLEQERGRG